MRRALGLENSAPTKAQTTHFVAQSGARRRQFVRDGEVPVTVTHDDAGRTNRLDEARQALREQIAARGHAERQLQAAQATIESLRTQLAHERIAREEALRHAEAGKAEIEQALQGTREELVAERQSRHQAEQQRDKALADHQQVEGQLREVIAAQKAQEASRGSMSGGRARKPTRQNP